MTIASLGLAVDSAPAVRAAVDLDKLAGSSATAEAAVARLGTSTSGVMGKIGAGAGAISQKLREAANDAESMAARINRALNIRAEFGGIGRGTDIAAYGAELDRLRTKFNPLFATIQQYKATQSEIRQAHAIGAIGIDEMTAALNRERSAALASIAALKGRQGALGQTRPGQGAGTFQTANIAAQFQDIAVTSAMGMAPLQIALQQGTQLSAVLNTMESPVRGLASAFLSVINPVSLVTIGVVALGAAAIQYFTTSGQGTKSLDDILKQHKDNIDRLGPAYAAATEAKNKYINESPELSDVRFGADRDDAIKNRLQEAKAASAEILSRSLRSQLTGDDFIFAAALPSKFEGATKAIDNFKRSVADGAPRVREFQLEIGNLVNNGAISAKIGQELLTVTNQALEAEDKLLNVSGTTDRVAKAFSDAQRAIDGINPLGAAGRLSDIESRLESLRKKMQAGEATTSDLSREINNLATLNPDLSSPINEIARLLGIAALAKAQIEGLSNTGKGDRLRGPGRSQNEFDDALSFFLRSDKDLREKLEAKNKEIDREARPKVDRDANAYRDLLKSAQDRVAQSKLEADSAGLSGIAQDVLRFKLDLLQKSQRKGREISEAQTKALLDQVSAYERNATAAAKATLMADLMFERQQMFRSPIDQTVASTLKGAGLPIDFNSEAAAAIRFNEQVKEARSLAGDFVSTFTQGLESGKSVWEAWGDAAMSVLDKITDKLLNDVLNALFEVNKVGSGSGGGLFGFLGSLLGGGSSGAAADPWAGMRMANGGAFTGGVQKFANGGTFTNSIVSSPTLFKFASGTGLMGEAGPEAIMPLKRDSSGRLGVSAGGGAANNNQPGQMRVTVGVSVDNNGNLQAYVKDVAQAEGQNAAVQVVTEREKQRDDLYWAGGHPR
ncbi:phage tail length tape measure family protein [Phyllobacterium sp. 22229]|uniref:phage tail length tape measure family protein n=1 Tax=Phyllobacterium sp. 22229 TaxID=3453895 RepID=UPI003F84B582